MTKQEIEAIRQMPIEFVRDGTQIAKYPDKGSTWIIINPDLKPMKSYDGGATWTPLEFVESVQQTKSNL